ncbi:HPr kinase/phosphorylase [Sphingomonas sp.]|uniref:HPr kinase/phosphorylase n=1 Tax=Sphingomonas sp. TaxID=28214 RepID=UPI003B00995F
MTAETIHASCVAIEGRAILIAGPSGSGKSDLALRLIDRGATLVCDDYTMVEPRDGRLWASAPATIAGRIEVRGVGILSMPYEIGAEVALVVACDVAPPRLPEPETRMVAGVVLPAGRVAALEPSAPIKVEWMLKALPA